ncbi:MAG: hypothetical protein IJ253_06515 [Bacteroidaceae bacterium]|nr:hypothetical protein [Bacteroidaceae bacterium]
MTPIEELNALKQIGNVPVSGGLLKSIFHEYRSPDKKVQALLRTGMLVKLKRGLFVVSPEISGKMLSIELVANHLYAPSYISAHYALRHYGLIPERVYEITSVTTLHSRRFENALGKFSYRGVSSAYFPIGIRSELSEGISYMIATPEKALCDMLMQERYVPPQSLASLEAFFEEDMRIDIDDIRNMDSSIIRACMNVGNKKNVLANLLKIMARSQ